MGPLAWINKTDERFCRFYLQGLLSSVSAGSSWREPNQNQKQNIYTLVTRYHESVWNPWNGKSSDFSETEIICYTAVTTAGRSLKTDRLPVPRRGLNLSETGLPQRGWRKHKTLKPPDGLPRSDGVKPLHTEILLYGNPRTCREISRKMWQNPSRNRGLFSARQPRMFLTKVGRGGRLNMYLKG